MYKMDHEIGNILTTMRTLEEEKAKIDAMNPIEREQYKLDPRKFNRLRLRWIEKTYAEMGQEMLRLLPQNPTKAIPIIYERFKVNYKRMVEEKQE
jgi:histone deacetylase complex regulatory component SIN3